MLDEVTDRTLKQNLIIYVVYLSNDGIKIRVTRYKKIFYLNNKNNILTFKKSKHLNYKQLIIDLSIKNWSKSKLFGLEKKWLYLEGLRF